MNIYEAYEILDISENERNVETINLKYQQLLSKLQLEGSSEETKTKERDLIWALILVKDYIRKTSKPNSINPEESNNKEKSEQDVFYKISFYQNDSLAIPKICPVCNRATNNEVKIASFYREMKGPYLNTIKTVEYKTQLSFFSCCEYRIDDKLIIIRNQDHLDIMISNPMYAYYFAKINHKQFETIESDKVKKEIRNHWINNFFAKPFNLALVACLIGSIFYAFGLI